MKTARSSGSAGRRSTAAPRFSIVIAAFNAQETIAATLESVLAQTYSSWDACVVDDGSTDDTSLVVARFARRDARIHLIRQANSGTGAARNAAATRAQGEFLCILDADDEYRPNYLESQAAFIDLHPGHDIYSCNADVVLASGAVEPFDPERYPRTVVSLRLEDMIRENRIFVAAVVRATSFKAAGGFREQVFVEDYDLWLRLLAGGGKHIHNPMSLVFYRVADHGKTADPVRALRSTVEVYRHLATTEAIDRRLVASIDRQVRDTERLIARLEAQAGWTELRRRLSTGEYRGARRRYWALRTAPIGRARYMAGLGLVALSPRLLAAAIRRPASRSGLVEPVAGRGAQGVVSVIVYCDGREGPLASTLESLARQTLARFTVLLAGMTPSEHDLPRIASGLLASKERDVSLLSVPGPVTTAVRNRAIAATRGRFAVELSAGDKLEATALEKAAWALETTPRAGLTTIAGTDAPGQHPGFASIGPSGLAAGKIEPGAYVLRVAAWHAIDGFDTKAPPHAADPDLAIRLARRGWESWMIPEVLVLHETAPGGGSSGQTGSVASAQRWLRSKHRRFHARAAAARLLGGATGQTRRRIPGLARLSRWVAWKLDVEGLSDRRRALRHPVDSLLRLAPRPIKGRLWRRLNLPLRPEPWTYTPPQLDLPDPSSLDPVMPVEGKAHRDRKTRLLVLHQYLAPGGAEAVVLNLMSGIDRNRFDLHLITTDFEPGGVLDHPWLTRFAEQTDSVYQLPAFLEKDYFLRFIVDFIASRRIDIALLSLSIFSYQALPQLRAACPDTVFLDLLHAEAPYSPMDHIRLAARYREFLDRRVVITDSLRDVQISKYGESPDRVVVIPNGIDTAKAFNPSNYPRGTFRRELGISDGVAVVLYYGRLSSEKRPMRLVYVAEQLRERSDIAIVLVGDGPETSALEKAIAARGLTNIQMKPARESIQSVLADADVVMFASEREGLPLAGIESMSMGKPIVASKVAGWVDLISDGVDGLLVDDGDIPGYASAVTRLLADRALYDRLARAGRRKATQKYDLGSSVRTWEKLLSTMPGRRTRRDA